MSNWASFSENTEFSFCFCLNTVMTLKRSSLSQNQSDTVKECW